MENSTTTSLEREIQEHENTISKHCVTFGFILGYLRSHNHTTLQPKDIQAFVKKLEGPIWKQLLDREVKEMDFK